MYNIVKEQINKKLFKKNQGMSEGRHKEVKQPKGDNQIVWRTSKATWA